MILIVYICLIIICTTLLVRMAIRAGFEAGHAAGYEEAASRRARILEDYRKTFSPERVMDAEAAATAPTERRAR